VIVPPFDRVVVDSGAQELPFSRAFLGRLPPGFPVETADAGSLPPRGRRTLHLTAEPGAFVKPCPCSPGVVRCGYWVLTLGFQCPYRCSYCFLRFYAPDEPLTLYANLDDAARAFHEALAGWDGPVRLGTGEFTDSLALDPWTRHSEWLRDLVAPHPNVVLELKTKSDRVEVLREATPLPNLVVAWSLNPRGRVASDELGTAPAEARLEAASVLAAAGYRVAFHFDPIVLEAGWEEEYGSVVRRLFEAVPPANIAWVSLGTLRFPPRFLERWGTRLRGNRAFFAEFVPGEDGKLRYFWPQRREAYRVLAGELRRRGGGGLAVYLCMEPRPMWKCGLGWEPEEGEVARLLAG
jgi:spore photoproduct lyase